MKIIILGAGQVGSSVAANLVSEANDITVVDLKPELLRELQDRFDLRTIEGHGAHPDVLVRAGAGDGKKNAGNEKIYHRWDRKDKR